MLKHIEPLPGAEREAAFDNRNGERRLCEGRFDVGWHVVGAFGAMDEERIAIGDEAAEEGQEIPLDIGIGVLLDQERR